MADASEISCNKFHSMPNLSDVCWFVKNTSSCDVDEGYFNYTIFVYCTMNGVLAAAVVILAMWWLFVFCGMAVSANEFFCPSLSAISQSLRLSHNIAGVTFLAVGNGAADIFSSIAAIGNAKSGDAGMAIGALFGAAIAMTAVVVGTIVIAFPFRTVERPFLRDVIFSLIATYWTWYVLWDKKMTLYEAAGFIILYCIYVLVVIVGRYIYQKNKRSRHPGSRLGNILGESTEEDNDPEVREPLLGDQNLIPDSINAITYDIQPIATSDAPDPKNLLPSFLHAINPINKATWGGIGIFWKAYECFKAPLKVLMLLTVPVVGEELETGIEDDLRKWNKPLNSLHLVTGPLCACLLSQFGLMKIGGVFPVWALILILGLGLAIVVFFTSKPDVRPRYHMMFAYLGFLVSVVWIYSFANEIVNVLQTIGIVFNLSNAILGLTLLAWGNAMGDFIADFTMARRGYPLMGISACFGGPLFNILLGLGIPFVVACIKKGGDFQLKVNMQQMVVAGGMAMSLIASLILVPLCRFNMTRSYGIFLLALYGVFLVVAILTETNIIPNTDL